MDFWLTLTTSLTSGAMTGLITIYFAYKQKVWETTLEVKKEAFLSALNMKNPI